MYAVDTNNWGLYVIRKDFKNCEVVLNCNVVVTNKMNKSFYQNDKICHSGREILILA